jgi:dolichol-phosphate mannosyltransferase
VLISIIIPVHNEAENIGQLIGEIGMLSLNYSYQIVVVDDASYDNTYAVLSEIKMNMPHLKIIRHKEKYGQSAAIATGVAHADGELIVTMDGDGQNDPADIPGLISTLLSNKRCRMVVGYRKRRKDSYWRNITSKIANQVRSALLKDHTPDTGCGLKIFYKSSFTSLPFFDHMHRFLPALIQMQGGEVISEEVKHRTREHGKSNYGTLDRMWAGIIDLMGVYWLRLRSKKVLFREGADE